MNPLVSIIIFMSILTGTWPCHSQRWHNLKTTYKLLPWNGFYNQPRTMSLAIHKGWLQVGSCSQANRKYPGERFIRNVKNNDIILIYDVQGRIAGMQSVVEMGFANNSFRNYENDSMYQPYRFDDGYEVYLTTAYFITPELICSKGRSKEGFSLEGTGNTLIFQNGSSIDPEYLITAPPTARQALDSGEWNMHRCFLNMGLHFSKWPASRTEGERSCENSFPASLLYSGGQLSGFAWQHFGRFKGDRYEHPPGWMINFMFRNAPSCLLEAQRSIGLSFMHVFFMSPYTLCILPNV